MAAQPQPVQMYDGVEISVLNKISKISAKHRALLFETLWEFERNTRLNFTRIFPSPGSCYYDQFFEVARPNNKLIYKYLCQRTELWGIIEQSIYNDLEPARDNWKDISVINNFEHPDIEREVEVEPVLNLDHLSSVKLQDANADTVREDKTSNVVTPYRPESFVDRRKILARKPFEDKDKELPKLTSAQP
jgi:hypothetical protein